MSQFPSLLAVTTAGQLLPLAEGKIYDVDDLAAATPLAVTDLNGLSFPGGTLTSANNGVLPPFRYPGKSVVSWVSGPHRMDIPATDIIPKGGEAGEVLAMGADGELNWVSVGAGGAAAMPAGGTTGQSLVKLSNADGDVGWKAVTGGGATNVIVLNETQAVPAGTPAGTLIVRAAGEATNPTTPDTPVTDPTTPGATAPTFVANSATTATGVNVTVLTMQRPANIQDGDLLVAVLHNHASGGTLTPPNGWAVIGEQPGNANLRLTVIMAYRVGSASTVPVSWDFKYSSAGRMVGTIFRVQGASKSGSLTAGSSGESNNLTASSVIPAFTLDTPALVVIAAQTQVTTSQTWPLPTTYSQSGFTRVLDKGNDETNRASATQSVLSVYVGPAPAGTFPQSTLTWLAGGGSRGALAIGVRSA